VLTSGLELRDPVVSASLSGGSLSVPTIRFALGGGTVSGNAALDRNGQLAAKLSARGIDLGSVLHQTGQTSELSGGRTDADIDIRGAGRSVHDIASSLDGTVFVHVGDGTIHSTDLDRLGFADLMVIVDKSLGRQDTVKLNCLVDRIDVRDGVATHRTLVMDSSRLTVVGRGSMNLGSETLDMHADPQAKITSLLSALPTIRITGTLAKPVYTPDALGTATDFAGSVVHAPEEVVGVAGGLAGGIAGTLVGGLTGGKAQLPQIAAGDDICKRALAGTPAPSRADAATPSKAGAAAQQPARAAKNSKPEGRGSVFGLPKLLGR